MNQQEWKDTVVVMREKQNFISKKPLRFWMLVFGAMLLPVLALPGWAKDVDLKNVEFAANGEQTDIILHTGSIVPVEKILVSDSKMILDIDQINAEETIHTNFAGAPNISHVIMQPLNEHKIRLIIRGEDLGTPNVAFSTRNGIFNAGNASGLDQASKNDLLPDEESQANTLAPLSNTADPIANNRLAELSRYEPISQKPAETAARPINKAASQKTPTEGLSIGNFSLLEPLATGKIETWIPYGLLGLVTLGLGLFIRHKILQFKRQDIQLEDLLEEQAQGKRVSFRDMADAYRNKHDVQQATTSNRKHNTEDVIGLRSLKQLEPEFAPIEEESAPMPEAKPQPSSKKLETILSAIQAAQAPKRPVSTAAPKKQAVNQYLKSQTPATPQKQTAAPIPSPDLQRELRRAQEVQAAVQNQILGQAPVIPANKGLQAKSINRAPAALKKNAPISKPVGSRNPAGNRPATAPGGQGPLPGNPEVLNFLRNVADLMEKDGKGEIAKSIHKNLNTSHLGGVNLSS